MWQTRGVPLTLATGLGAVFAVKWADLLLRNTAASNLLGVLQADVAAARRALRRALRCGDSAVEVRAALGIIGTAVRAVEMNDLLERVEQLEAADRLRQ